ncbi:restriction endonuclease subunit S [Acinetobacter sp. GFQ9D192M]|uniref:restriction endonuclease subunit S n=1 Tax=unclassified Acinetobacter TaxID=196816 RepID=UPI0014083B22|nr:MULTISPECIES: restriction endonuclease subunit S [unclassified Acinetobacter]NHB66688.1 restriction endonuclease subunit S [Acinetobacter sp. GFQ9D191M]NHC01485.1 restriction endonuclease subunit S [Acinetobacter sp. GFQ9D192M]
MAAPKLRFKEFDNQWDKIKINDQAQTVTSGSRDWAQYYSESGDKFIRMTNLVRDGIYLDLSDLKFVQLPKDSNEGKRTSLKFGDILISITAELGKLGWIPEGLGTAYINQHTALVRMKDSVDSKFIAYSLSTEKYNNKLNSLNDSGAKAGLNLGTIRNFELIVPPKEEQTKIASFLSAVDEKISQLTQKHALLSQYKQGMMQKLFSQQIRFKADDGSEFGEWEEKTLIDSVDTNIKWSFTGGPFGSNLKSEDYTELGIRIIQLQNIGDGAFLNDYKIYTSPEKANELLSCNIYPDEILISKMGDPVARCCIVPKHHDRYVMCSDGIRLVVDKQNYSSIFMFYQINYQDFRQSASDVSTGSTRKRIGLSDLKQVPIKVPCLEEQTKIANFLSSIDQKLEVVAQQIEQAKQWKKGLLQQMFV